MKLGSAFLLLALAPFCKANMNHNIKPVTDGISPDQWVPPIQEPEPMPSVAGSTLAEMALPFVFEELAPGLQQLLERLYLEFGAGLNTAFGENSVPRVIQGYLDHFNSDVSDSSDDDFSDSLESDYDGDDEREKRGLSRQESRIERFFMKRY